VVFCEYSYREVLKCDEDCNVSIARLNPDLCFKLLHVFSRLNAVSACIYWIEMHGEHSSMYYQCTTVVPLKLVFSSMSQLFVLQRNLHGGLKSSRWEPVILVQLIRQMINRRISTSKENFEPGVS
jgi:hypothetical protein